jgi:hypothetical protein
MPFIAARPAFGITADIREKLMTISPATIDRALKADRKKLAIRHQTGETPEKAYPGQDPLPQPGFFGIDTVHHCGERDAGEFCLSLTAADAASGWVEPRPLLNKARKWIMEALGNIHSGLPFPLRGIDSDNGSEFINHTLLSWCDTNHITFTRTRPYKKNDNRFVERKNLKCVRDYVGYHRFDTAGEHQALARLYRSLCPLLNYFLPTVKLIDRQRVGAKVRKVYDKPRSPYQRLTASPDLSDEVRAEPGRRCQSFNPVLCRAAP